MTRSVISLGLMLCSASLLACGRVDTQNSASSGVPAPSAATASTPASSDSTPLEAGEIFKTRCSTCHGESGLGNGPAAQGLTPPPRNFHDAEWQRAVTDEHIEQVIQYGGAAVGKSPAMPGNPDLMSKPAVVTALRVHVREFGR